MIPRSRVALRHLPPVIAILLAAAPARAEEDAQLWTAIAATGPVHGELGVFAYAEARAGNDVSRLSQTVLGIGAGWDRSPRFSLYGGYLLTTTRLAGPNLREHRLWQQASYAIGTAGRVHFSGRTMLQQRMFQHDRDLGWRVQQHLRATIPVTRDDRLRVVGYGELLLNLNDTRWGARAGVDQIRGFAGMNLPVGRHQTIEVGYFRQQTIRHDAPDRVNHVGLFLLVHRFK